ncbi:hypothetical protein BU15DRAFT_65755 [Melanogaster broomeanus]|nr:hypothetical protein BU15DRAFT_65755 [Melanogaster broomeanus]
MAYTHTHTPAWGYGMSSLLTPLTVTPALLPMPGSDPSSMVGSDSARRLAMAHSSLTICISGVNTIDALSSRNSLNSPNQMHQCHAGYQVRNPIAYMYANSQSLHAHQLMGMLLPSLCTRMLFPLTFDLPLTSLVYTYAISPNPSCALALIGRGVTQLDSMDKNARDKGKGQEVVRSDVGAKAERKNRARKEGTIWPEGDNENANANDAPTPPTDKPRPQGPTIRVPPLKLTSVMSSSSSVASKKEPACDSCVRKNVDCLPRGNGNGACQSCWQGKMRCSLLKKDMTGAPGSIDVVSSPNAEASSSRKCRRDSMVSDPNTTSDRWKGTLGERQEEDTNPPTKFQQREKKQMKWKKRERETVQPLSKNAFRRQSSPDPLVTMSLPSALVPAGNARGTTMEARLSALEKTIDGLMRMVEVLWKDGKEDEMVGLERDLGMAQLASTSRDPSIPTSSAAEGCGNSPSIPLWNAITEESLESSEEMDASD